jgi:uncharacterized protein
MKAVFDTNVYIAAFVTNGVCAKILHRGRQGQFKLIGSPFILNEFERVLIKKFSLSRPETREATRLISEAMHIIIHPEESVTGVCRDPDDDAILACALGSKADYLMTGDGDLLKLRAFRETRIVPPREFELLFSD